MLWILLTLLSAFFLASRTMFAKHVLRHESSQSVILLVSLFASLYTLLFASRIDFSPEISLHLLILVQSLIMAVATYLGLEVLRRLPVSKFSPLRNLSVIFLLVLSFFILGERPTIVQLLGVFIIIIGAYLIELESLKEWKQPLRFLFSPLFLLFACSFLLLSISAIVDKVLMQSIAPMTQLFWLNLFVGGWFLLLVLGERKQKEVVHLWRSEKPWIFLLPAVGIASAWFYLKALTIPGVLVTLVMPIKRLSTVFATGFGGKFFHEGHVLARIAISLVMVGGVLLIVL